MPNPLFNLLLRRDITLTLFALLLTILVAPPSHAQFHSERAIGANETALNNGTLKMSIECNGQPSSCDVVLFGFQSRKPGRWHALSDTVLKIVPHRYHTLICHKKGFMFHAESFWPDLLREPEIRVGLRPIVAGSRTDILGIYFQGDQDRLHPKSLTVAKELLTWLEHNPDVRIQVIGHVNGADGRRSSAFYRRASVRRANALIQWLVAKGISAERLEPYGRGAQALLYPDPVYAWQHEANRRVEIEVLEH
jgi:outer membrane protein OmpA-like peptidoglycan-associated protein